MSYTVLDSDGVKRYFTALGDGTSGSPYRSTPMSYSEAAVDMGLLFIHSNRTPIANNGILSYLIKTPASPAHVELLEISVASDSAAVYVDFFENTVVTANGTTELLLNLNRQALINANTELYRSPTFNAGSEGITIFKSVMFGERDIGGIDREQNRVILKPSYNYLIKIQNVSGATANIAIKIIIGED